MEHDRLVDIPKDDLEAQPPKWKVHKHDHHHHRKPFAKLEKPLYIAAWMVVVLLGLAIVRSSVNLVGSVKHHKSSHALSHGFPHPPPPHAHGFHGDCSHGHRGYGKGKEHEGRKHEDKAHKTHKKHHRTSTEPSSAVPTASETAAFL
uniref:ARAD1B19558p n=1 Tax=Blastobotrys adeninivorans TaxID=409370 RepID=A0A060TC24_BLAAD